MTDMAIHDAAMERDLGGCPVMHRDFAPQQAAGRHWELGDELRETSPVYFNTFAQPTTFVVMRTPSSSSTTAML